MKKLIGSVVLLLVLQVVIAQNIGVNTVSPSQKLEVNGKMKIGNDANTPTEGTIRWNPATQDFEGFDGSNWRSLTKSNYSAWGYSDIAEKENRKIVANDGTSGDRFGISVSISGDYAIVGAALDNSNGAAYIFKKIGSNWIQDSKLVASDGAPGDFFGYSVSISGDYAIVGCPSDNIGANNDQGSAYIFYRIGTTWSQQLKITGNDGAFGDFFGSSVSLNGDYAAIGAPTDDLNATADAGSTYIFIRNGTNWLQQAKISASDGTEQDYFGNSVCINGNYVIVGSYAADVSGNIYQGAAYVFERSGTSWTQQSKLTPYDGAELDYFGSSVSISGNYAIVGSPYSNIGSNGDQGAAYIFILSSNIWYQQAKLTAFDGTMEDNFGYSVSIAGDYAIVGALKETIANNGSQGAAYIFKRTGSDWVNQTKIASSDGGAIDYFGTSVCISPDFAIVGAEYHDVGNNSNQGAAYIYKRNQ